MGANFQFDSMLPTIALEAGTTESPTRQVEVFTHGEALWLRVGAVGKENSGEGRYTVRLSKANAKELAEAIENGATYLGL